MPARPGESGAARTRRALRGSGLFVVLAVSGTGSGWADTLLMVRPAAGELEMIDPGSGLRLAVVPVGSGPRKVGVAPDEKRAVVANCGDAAEAAPQPAVYSQHRRSGTPARTETLRSDAAGMPDAS